jgi:hypothetical protein
MCEWACANLKVSGWMDVGVGIGSGVDLSMSSMGCERADTPLRLFGSKC